MKIKGMMVLLMVMVCGIFLYAPEGRPSQAGVPTAFIGYDSPPLADAGRDFLTYVGLPSEFRGYGATPDDEIALYEWDFDGDGAYDLQSIETGLAFHTYRSPGTYHAVLRVHDTRGNIALDATKVIVMAGAGKQEYLPTIRPEPGQTASTQVQGDGTVERYVIMINGSSERRFWDDVTFMYSTLTGDYGIPPERIYLFNEYGTNPDGVNPDNMIDYPAIFSYIDDLFTQLSSIIDGDDELFVWITDHGKGYYGPQFQSYGYLGSRASVDPGDEQDYLERDFKLRSLTTGGNYALPTYNHGMNVFKVFYQCYSYGCRMYRNKYVSIFANLYFEQHGVQSDSDVYIEKLVDYLLGDTNRDGLIETAQGEVFDYDGDGDPPYDPATASFDEDDWGALDHYEDNFNYINSGHPGSSYMIFDHNFDNHVDIDIDYDPGNLEVDGTDLDNEGLFDGIDVNEDGDMDDWVSIDERLSFCTASPNLYDDDLAVLLNRIRANVISLFMEPCFSGGFIEDVSKPGRVLMTSTEEETPSYGNYFVELFTSALHRATRDGTPVDADDDRNGHISMREAFNYAAQNDPTSEVPQYDDNGDGIGHPHPIPQGGDGALGAVTYLESFYGLVAHLAAHAQSGDPGQVVTYTLCVTNTGNVADTFDIAVSGHTWPTDAPGTTDPLAAGKGANVDVTVQIPASAAGDAFDTATVSITSQGDDTQSVTAALTTTANVVYDLTVSPLTDAQSGDPGQAITYTLHVANTGNLTDTFDIAVSGHTWPTDAPGTAGPLAAGKGTDVDVTVQIPASAAGDAFDTATVTLTSQGDDTQSATATLTTTANVLYGLTASPLTDAQSGDPGQAITYTLHVTNTGNVTDTLDIAVSGRTWPTNAPGTAGPLAAGKGTDVDVTVQIPASAAGDAFDTATVTLTSQGDDTQSATATLTTTANVVYGLTVSPLTDVQSGDPGQAITYTLHVTNTGNVADTFDIAVSGHTWPTSLPGMVGPLAAGGAGSVTATVSIPTWAGDGETDTATITITSQGDRSKWAKATLTTAAEITEPPMSYLFLPLIIK